MIKVENIKVYNLARAVYSARNALNSWDKSDSDLENDILGENDLDLAKRLYKGGDPSHRKFMRSIFIAMDIIAPLFWWSQFDTYKVGTTANSCSKMHRIHTQDFQPSDFSFGEDFLPIEQEEICASLNNIRIKYNETGNKAYWRKLIKSLPSAYNQKRTVTMNYENAVTIIKQRTGHKLDEWHDFIEVLKNLPYLEEIMGE